MTEITPLCEYDRQSLFHLQVDQVTKIPTHDDIYPGHLIKGAGKMEGLLGYG